MGALVTVQEAAAVLGAVLLLGTIAAVVAAIGGAVPAVARRVEAVAVVDVLASFVHTVLVSLAERFGRVGAPRIARVRIGIAVRILVTPCRPASGPPIGVGPAPIRARIAPIIATDVAGILRWILITRDGRVVTARVAPVDHACVAVARRDPLGFVATRRVRLPSGRHAVVPHAAQPRGRHMPRRNCLLLVVATTLRERGSCGEAHQYQSECCVFHRCLLASR